MFIDHSRLYQLFKYLVYAALTVNAFVFFSVEWAASSYRFADGVAIADIIEGFAATIDTSAWIILLLMFELETYVLEDRQFTRPVTLTLHGLRIISYVFIIYAFTGYVRKLLFVSASVPLAGVSDLCALVDGVWSYAVGFDEYEVLTPANCATMSTATSFLQFPGLNAVVDAAGLTDIVRLAWVDVVNAGVWLLIVVVLEVDVRLQEHGMFEGWLLKASTVSKIVLYSTLFLAAAYWSVKGDFVDSWDAWLWLVAFIFIELNVFEWRHESMQEQALAENGPT